jgi:hypothetical protein
MDTKTENIRKRDAGLLPELQKISANNSQAHI